MEADHSSVAREARVPHRQRDAFGLPHRPHGRRCSPGSLACAGFVLFLFPVGFADGDDQMIPYFRSSRGTFPILSRDPSFEKTSGNPGRTDPVFGKNDG